MKKDCRTNRALVAVAGGLIISVLLSLCGFSYRCDQLRPQIFRLHILANSDSREDQDCKLAVRDRLLRETQSDFARLTGVDEAVEWVDTHRQELLEIVQDEVRKQGYDYAARLEVAPSEFPVRQYDEAVFPAGEYSAMRIVLGAGEGHNWWCVLLPPICLSACSERETLAGALDDDGFELVENGERYTFKLKAVEIYRTVAGYLRHLLEKK